MLSSKAQVLVFLAIAMSSSLILANTAPPQPLQVADMDHEKHMQAQASEPSLEQQIKQLQESVARLEVALKMNHQGKSQTPSMGKMGGMKKGPMGSTPVGKMGMGSMGMGKMAAQGLAISALPGFPGASHLYHIGATGFFLDHTQHIVLSKDQMLQLSKLRESATLKQASAQRNIDQAEQDLWELTGADAPDAVAIEAKVRQVEKLLGDQRIAFIRAVGQAGELLSEDQRRQLSGMLPAGPAPLEPDSMEGMR